MNEAQQCAATLLPLYNRITSEYIRFTELASKALLDPGMVDLDFREFELAAARLEGTLVEIQAMSRRTWETHKRLTEGLREQSREQRHDPTEGARNAALTAQDSRE